MGMQQYFGGAIWTNHALERMQQRGLPQKLAYEAFQFPQTQKRGKQPGTIEYGRKFDEHFVTVIAKQNERKEWIILSCWVDPPYEGFIDDRKLAWQRQYHGASLWRKLWLEIRRQIGF